MIAYISGILLVLAIMIGLFLLLRGLIMWYFKIHELKQTNEVLGKIIDLQNNSLTGQQSKQEEY